MNYREIVKAHEHTAEESILTLCMTNQFFSKPSAIYLLKTIILLHNTIAKLSTQNHVDFFVNQTADWLFNMFQIIQILLVIWLCCC